MDIVRNDLSAYLQDRGLDATIKSLIGMKISVQELTLQINTATGMSLDADSVLHYIADRQAAGALLEFSADGGSLPEPIARYAAPTGIGQSADGLWFSTPNTGTHTIRWYTNGVIKVERSQDCASNRSASKAELGAMAGDVVQVAIIDGGVCGWWGRITVT
jgi:hypothetical protein